MKRSVAVFDFDKTLTDKDTLFGFYKTVAGNDLLFLHKRMILLATGVLYKAGLIKNSSLKRIGIYLFLKGRTRDDMEAAAQQYAKEIKLNDIYKTHYINSFGEKWVVSASPEIYLKYVFPGENVAGTILRYRAGKVMGLDVNMFGLEKKRFLIAKGINKISEIYTDSLTDKPLIDISEKVYIVNQGYISHMK